MSTDKICFQGVILERQVEDNGIVKLAVYDYDNETKRILTIWKGWIVKAVIGRQYFMEVTRNISGETTYDGGKVHRSNSMVLSGVVEIVDRDSEGRILIPITKEREKYCAIPKK